MSIFTELAQSLADLTAHSDEYLLTPGDYKPLDGSRQSPRQVATSSASRSELGMCELEEPKVNQRYLQITRIENTDFLCPKEVGSVVDYKYHALCLAHYIVKNQPHSFSVTNSYVKNRDFPQCKIQYDAHSGDIYLLLLKKNHAVREALRLPFLSEENPLAVSQIVSNTPESLVRLRESAEIAERLAGKRGIQPLLSCCLYKTAKNRAKFSVLTPLATSLYDISQQRHLTLEELLPLIEDLALGLDCLHTNNLIHGAIDATCAVVSKEMKASWTNFSLSRKPHSSLFSNGYYGSRLYTSPEILWGKEEEIVHIDPHKADIWAFGQLIYELYFYKPVPWHGLVEHYHEQEIRDDQTGAQLALALMKHIDAPKNELRLREKHWGLDLKHELEILIYSMLDSCLFSRLSIKDVIATIGAINQKRAYTPNG
jgi:serine/threonine protein kinase